MGDGQLGFATRQIHTGREGNAAGSLCTPIYASATYITDSIEQAAARFNGQEQGYLYSRLGNPTVAAVERTIADLEGAQAACAASSGMGAVTCAVWSCLSAGDVLVADETLYGCTQEFFTADLPRFGVETRLVDFTDPAALAAAIDERVRVVYFETPCNPTLRVVDIEAVAAAAHAANPAITVIVDNTFATPYLQQPLALGADVVVHSATKYLNGHGDVIAGFVVGSAEFVETCRMSTIKAMTGSVMGPFEAFLISRGLKTLDLRMQRHCANARALAEFLRNHPAVKTVYYPGFEDYPGHEVAARQMRDFGGMVSIELDATVQEAAAALNRLKVALIAVSLGDAETLVELPAGTSHSGMSAEDRAAAGIADGLVRISVGLEDADDIIADFAQALSVLR